MSARFHIAHPTPARDGYLCAFSRQTPFVGGTASGPTADAARASAMQAVRDALAADAREAKPAARHGGAPA